MFFFLSKLLDIAVDPFWWTFVLTLLGVLLLGGAERAQASWWRGVSVEVRRARAHRLIALGLGCLTLLSLPSVSNRLWRSLETGAQRTQQPSVTYDAVVLLGGAVHGQGSLADEPAWNDNVERLLTTRALLASGKAKVAILSGGQISTALPTEAEFLARELIALGIPKESLFLDTRANNTRENALESKKLLEQLGAKKVLVVTSAFHAPRALGCFRAAGLEVDMLPVDYRMRDPATDPHVAPRAEYLSQSTRAIREWVGRAVYAALGYTK